METANLCRVLRLFFPSSRNLGGHTRDSQRDASQRQVRGLHHQAQDREDGGLRLQVRGCLDFKDDNSHRLSKDDKARSGVFVEEWNLCVTLSINDGLVVADQAQAGIQVQCEDKRFLSSVLTPSVRVDFMRNPSGANS